MRHENRLYHLSDIKLESPFMNSAGSLHGTNTDFLLDKVRALSQTRIGAITLGSFTIPKREGNAATFGHPTYHYDLYTGRTYNSKGLPGPGLDRILELAPLFNQIAGDKPLIYSGSTTFATPEIGEGPEQISRLAYDFFDKARAKIVEVDAGCPHILATDGQRMPIVGYDYEVMDKLIDGLQNAIGTGQKIGIKLPPYLSIEQRKLVPKIAKRIRESGVFAYLATSNTIPDQVPLDERGAPILSVLGGKGGMSGPATKAIGQEQLCLWRQAMGPNFEIVSSLGVDSGEEIAVRLRLGATAVAATSLFLQCIDNWSVTANHTIEQFDLSIKREQCQVNPEQTHSDVIQPISLADTLWSI